MARARGLCGTRNTPYMPLIRDVAQSDYSIVEELLYSNDLGNGRYYEPAGIDVIVAELHGSVVGVAEFKLHDDFGHDEGREAHPGEQTFVLTMAVADTARRNGVGPGTPHRHRPPRSGSRRHLPGPGPPGRRGCDQPTDVLPGVRAHALRTRYTGCGMGLPAFKNPRRGRHKLPHLPRLTSPLFCRRPQASTPRQLMDGCSTLQGP
jgi:hypothetical protein